jgi:hypothetical protein
MAKRLTKLKIDEVSSVDKGANNKRFLLLKRHTEEGSSLFGKKDKNNTDGGQDMTTMTAEDIKQAVGEAAEEILTPVLKRIDDLEAHFEAEGAEGEAEEVTKTNEEPTQEVDMAEVIGKAVAEAVQPLADRIGTLEQVRGVRKSAEPTGENEEGKSVFAGVF